MLSDFAIRLKERRKALNLTQRALAKRIGKTDVELSMYENDHREPGWQTLKRLCTALQCSADYLLGRKDSPE